MMDYRVPEQINLSLWNAAGQAEVVHGQALDSHELAWAAGFFDGEGCTMLKRAGMALALSLPQVEPQPLERFKCAVGGRGRVSGPWQESGRVNPIYCWRLNARRDVQAVLTFLWPYLCAPKRAQAAAAFAAYRAASTTIRRNGRAATAEERAQAVEAYRANLRARALEAVSAGACGQQQIQAWVQCDRRTLLELLAGLVASGRLTQSGLGRRGRPYVYGLAASGLGG